MGLVRPCGCGPGEFGLCRARVVCRFPYSPILAVGYREEVCVRRCRKGVGRGYRLGGQDWAWWSGKKLKLIDLVVIMHDRLHFLFSIRFPLLATQLASAVCAAVCWLAKGSLAGCPLALVRDLGNA